MSSEYGVHHDERDFRVEVTRLDEGGLLFVKVDEDSFTIKVESCDDGSWEVNDTISDHNVRIIKRTGKTITVELNGEVREVEWIRLRKAQAAGVPSTTSSATGPKVSGGVYPPMPGKITEVNVKVGDSVKSGDTVCILEAMKMFNELKAPSDGTVKEVNVEPGSAVTPSDLLILIK